MPQYDINIHAMVRVSATSEDEAQQKIDDVGELLNIDALIEAGFMKEWVEIDSVEELDDDDDDDDEDEDDEDDEDDDEATP